MAYEKKGETYLPTNSTEWIPSEKTGGCFFNKSGDILPFRGPESLRPCSQTVSKNPVKLYHNGYLLQKTMIIYCVYTVTSVSRQKTVGEICVKISLRDIEYTNDFVFFIYCSKFA